MGKAVWLVALVAGLTAAGCGGDNTGTPAPDSRRAEATNGGEVARAGTWRPLPPAPAGTAASTASWTGTSMVVFSRVGDPASPKDQARCLNVAASYVPATRIWRRLTPPVGPAGRQVRQCFQGTHSSVWTGEEVLVTGASDLAYNPRTNRWRRLPGPAGPRWPGNGVVVWTGREMVSWGGGCCGDAMRTGTAYNPANNSWRNLAPAPLVGRQPVAGAWTGRELIIAGGGNADISAVYRGAAAYDPGRDSWRRIAPLPAPRAGAIEVWTGRELLVVGGSDRDWRPARVGFAYDPAADHWRPLPPMPSPRISPAAVWTGRLLLLWGGAPVPGTVAARGLAYDPIADRWSALPRAPIQARADPVAVWTERQMIVWGGRTTEVPPKYLGNGAAFRPLTP